MTSMSTFAASLSSMTAVDDCSVAQFSRAEAEITVGAAEAVGGKVAAGEASAHFADADLLKRMGRSF